MTIYKDVEVEVDVELKDFDFEDICSWVKEVSESEMTPYEEQELKALKKALRVISSDNIKDFVYQMERETFEELFEEMKNSWQNT